MTKLIYTPEGAEPREFDYDLNRLPVPDVQWIEENLGMGYAEFRNKVGGWYGASRALLFLLLRAEEGKAGLRFEDVKPFPGEIAFDLDDAQFKKIVDRVRERQAAGEELDDNELGLLNLWAQEHPDDTGEPGDSDGGEGGGDGDADDPKA